MAPSGIAPEIVSRINEALNAVLNNRDIIEKFKASGTLPKPGRPEDLAKFIDSESLHWGRLAVEIDAKVE